MGTAVRRQRQKRGPRGAGRVTVLKSGAGRVYVGEEAFDIPAEGLHETYGSWAFKPVGTATKSVFVELSGSEQELRNVRPFDGNFFVKFSRLASRDGKPPTIISQAERQPEGFQYPIRAHEEFYAILEVVNHKDYEGMEIPLTLWYLFDVDANTEEVFIAGGRSNAFANLMKFLEVAGYDFDADTLKPGEPGEILQQLNDLLSKRGAVFQCQLKGGYVPFNIAEALSLAPEGSV